MIYLDNAASTPMYSEAIKAMQKSLLLDFANSAAKHKLGTGINDKITSVRENILHKLNGTFDYDLVFTSSATEANNLAINSFPADFTLFTNPSMHPSLTQPLLKQKNEKKIKLNLADVYPKAEGFNPSAEAAGLSIAHVDSVSGFIAPIKILAGRLKAANPESLIHIDATQSFGKVAIDLKHSNADFLTIAAHKMGGPKGIAALIYKKSLTLNPILFGGSHEGGLRPSTINSPAISGWKEAVEASYANMNKSFEKILSLKTQLKKHLIEAIPGIHFPEADLPASPYILLLVLPDVASDIVMRFLDEKEIYVSSSTACNSKSDKPSPAFDELGIDKHLQKNVLRVSFSYKTNAFETNRFCEALIENYKMLTALKRK